MAINLNQNSEAKQPGSLLDFAVKVGSDTHRLRMYMLLASGAHACAVKHSHESRGLRVQRRFASLLPKDVLERHIESIDKRRHRLMRALDRRELELSSATRTATPNSLKNIKDQFPPPSRFWKALQRLDLLTNSRCLALVIGADQETTRILADNCLVATWPLGMEARGSSPLLDTAIDITCEHPRLEELKPMSLGGPYSPNIDVSGPEECRGLFTNIKTVAGYFLRPAHEGLPVSVLSIPVPLKPSPWAGPSDFLSVELYWFGLPISLNNAQFEHLIACANHIAPRLIFDPSRNEVVEFVEELATDIKRVDSICHSSDDWQRHYGDLLKPYPQFQIQPELLAQLGTPLFHGGLEHIHRLNQERVPLRRPLRLHSLWARTVCHLLYHGVEVTRFYSEVTPSLLELCSFDGCDIDVVEWHEFIVAFNRQAETKADAPLVINSASLVGNSLTVYFNPHPKRNKDGKADLSNFRSLLKEAALTKRLPKDHQSLHALYKTFLKLNSTIEVELDKRTLTIRINPQSREDGTTTLIMNDSSLVISLDAPNWHTFYRFRGDDCVFVLDEDQRRGELLGQLLRERGKNIQYVSLARMRAAREVPKSLLAHARDLKSLFASDAEHLTNWPGLSPTIIAYTGDSQAPLRRIDRELSGLPSWAVGLITKYGFPLRVDGLPEHEVKRLSEAIFGGTAANTVLHALKLRNYPSVILLLQSLCLREAGTSSDQHNTEQNQLKIFQGLFKLLIEQLTSLKGEQGEGVKYASFCRDLLEEARMYLETEDWNRVARAVAASQKSSDSLLLVAPIEFGDAVAGILDVAKQSTGNQRWQNRTSRRVAVLHTHDLGILRSATAAAFGNVGVDAYFLDMHSDFSLPQFDEDVVLVRTEAFQGVAEMDLLLELDAECGKTSRRLFVLDLIGTISPVWQYLAKCGSCFCRPDDFFSLFFSQNIPTFTPTMVEANNDIQDLMRSYLEHDFDLRQYAGNLRNIMPWLGTLKRNKYV